MLYGLSLLKCRCITTFLDGFRAFSVPNQNFATQNDKANKELPIRDLYSETNRLFSVA